MATDIIISAFASADRSNLQYAGLGDWEPSQVQPLSLFSDRPLLLQVPKTGAPGKEPEAYGTLPFERTAARYKRAGGGSVLSGCLKELAPGVEPRRICLIGFSAGNKFVHDALAQQADAELVDTVLSLDGLVYAIVGGKPYLPSFEPYLSFAERATGLRYMLQGVANPYLSPLFVHAHTKIELVDPATQKISTSASSTHKAADLMFQLLNDRYYTELAHLPAAVVTEQAQRQARIENRLRVALDSLPDVTIRCGGASKRFAPGLPRGQGGLWPWIGRLGNYWDLNFEGTQGPDHCMIAFLAQKALFESYLAPRWNARSGDVAGLGALGSAESPSGRVRWASPSVSSPGGGLVQAGALDTGVSYGAVAAAVAVGAAVGMAVGRHWWAS